MDAQKQADMFKALGVASRIRIIDLLKQKGPLGVSELSEELGITPSAVSQHLKVLRFAGLVRSERKGYWLPYEIDTDSLEKCGEMLSGVCACGCQDSCRALQTDMGKAGDTAAQLKEYEQKLKKELARVVARIEEIEGSK